MMANGPNEPNVTELMGEAVRDSTELARQELALFKTELSENVSHLFTGVALMVAAAVFAIAALSLFVEALVEWLATLVGSEALAALIVGGVIALIGIGLVLYGRRLFSKYGLTPERTMRSLHRDAEVLSHRVSK
jgi:hypothetical protein